MRVYNCFKPPIPSHQNPENVFYHYLDVWKFLFSGPLYYSQALGSVFSYAHSVYKYSLFSANWLVTANGTNRAFPVSNIFWALLSYLFTSSELIPHVSCAWTISKTISLSSSFPYIPPVPKPSSIFFKPGNNSFKFLLLGRHSNKSCFIRSKFRFPCCNRLKKSCGISACSLSLPVPRRWFEWSSLISPLTKTPFDVHVHLVFRSRFVNKVYCHFLIECIQ